MKTKYLLFLALFAMSLQSYAYEIVQGSKYKVCKDLSAYLGDKIPSGKYPESGRLLEAGKAYSISTPKWDNESVDLGVTLMIRDESPKILSVARWKQRIADIEKITNSSFEIFSADVDINNNGKANRVVSFSWVSHITKSRHHLAYIIDEYRGLHKEFFSKGRTPNISGELFKHEDRLFSLTIQNEKLLVSEFFEHPMRDGCGLYVKGEVCVIKNRNSKKN